MKNKVALVTGALTGIGRAAAFAFAAGAVDRKATVLKGLFRHKSVIRSLAQ